MAAFIKGDVVVVPFPFCDLSDAKRRPALVVATMSGDDVVLCQITRQAKQDDWAIAIDGEDLEGGSLKQSSNVRPNRLSTCDSGIILYRVGTLSEVKMRQVTQKIIDLFTA